MDNEYYDLQVGFSCAGQMAKCVFVYRIADPSESDEYENAKQLVEATDDGAALSWLKKLQAVMSEDAFISSLRSRRISSGGGNTAGVTFETTDLPGAIVSEIHTQQVAQCCIWIRNDTPGVTGRNFIPAVPENALIGSRWQDAHVTLVQAFITKHLTGLSTATGLFLPCIYDREAETGTIIDEGYLSPWPGTQRRRELPV